MNAFCILFANDYKGYDVGGVDSGRIAASLPIGSRYRAVDYILSSLVASEIPNIGVITSQNYIALMDHLGWGKEWDLNRKNSGLTVLPPMVNEYGNTIPKTKFEAMIGISKYINRMLQDYVIVAESDIIFNIDFKDLLNFHIDKNADVTMVYVNKKPQKFESELFFDDRGKIYESMYYNDNSNKKTNVNLNLYVMHKDLLKEIINKGNSAGWTDLTKDFISKNFHKLNVYGYRQKTYCKTIKNLQDYYDVNMDLLDEDVRKQLYFSEIDILTRTRDSVPTKYGKYADVKNCVIADGCIIEGKVENSILFRDVRIEENATVKNCIIMNSTVVKNEAKIEYVVSDKKVVIGNKQKLIGAKNCPLVIPKGKEI